MKVWTARRVGDRILCGRLVAGSPRCGGELARVVGDGFELPGGLVRMDVDRLNDRPMYGGVVHWRESERARRRRLEGQGVSGSRFAGGTDEPMGRPGRGEPFTRDCPRCSERNLVEYRLL